MASSAKVLDSLERKFELRRNEFLDGHEGQWAVLWTNGDVLFRDSEMEAVSAGYGDRERSGPFTVKEVLKEDRVIFLSRVSLKRPPTDRRPLPNA